MSGIEDNQDLNDSFDIFEVDGYLIYNENDSTVKTNERKTFLDMVGDPNNVASKYEVQPKN